MSSKIQNQSAKVWQILTNPKTAKTYKDAIVITWNILKETAVLLWLVVCLVLVATDWFWTNSILAGRRSRLWLSSLEGVDTSDLTSEAGKKLLSASKASVLGTISQAREQLGLPQKKEPVLAIPEQKEKEPASAEAPSPAPTYAVPSPTPTPEQTPSPTTPSAAPPPSEPPSEPSSSELSSSEPPSEPPSEPSSSELPSSEPSSESSSSEPSSLEPSSDNDETGSV
ncbi:MAG TPA: hypothetical protein ACFE0H_08445 [Elainellaceae cyanobacterium]